MSKLQILIDNYIRTHVLRSVKDIIYIPQDNVVVVLRKQGYRNVSIDVNESASPSEAFEKVTSHLAVY